MEHESAKEDHYDEDAKDYDLINEERSVDINLLLEKKLREAGAHKILDLSCGTGSQVFWLWERGFDVVGIDINEKMLEVAKHKAQERGADVILDKGDMRDSRVGEFDAAITIFNAVGHLTKDDFLKAMGNIHGNLRGGGVYIFDIFNASFLQHEDNITQLTIDWLEREPEKVVRKIQYSTIDHEGVLASYTTTIEGEGKGAATSQGAQTLQVYHPEDLERMLLKSGFSMVELTGIDGKPIDPTQTEKLVVLARK